MHSYDYLIIGGGIAGITAAETIRARDARGSVGVIAGESHLLYSRVAIPSYLKKRIPKEKLFLRSLDDFTQKRIDVRLGDEAVKIDLARREVELSGGNRAHFQRLLIATGGKVNQWGRKEDADRIYHLQTLDDAERLIARLDSIKAPLVIGSSFIALECMEILALRKIPVIVLMRDAHFFGKLIDLEAGALLHKHFADHGVAIRAADETAFMERHGDMREVSTKGGREKIRTDAILAGVGIRRAIDFLKGSGIELGDQGVRTNEFLETTTPHVWAAGDVAEYFDLLRASAHVDGNWTSAFLQGKNAGINMTGGHEAFSRVPSYSITNLGFQITMMGDTNNGGMDTVMRIDPHTNSYERFFIKEGVVVGAALINRFSDKALVARLIETKTPLREWQSRLADMQFDLAEIPLAA